MRLLPTLLAAAVLIGLISPPAPGQDDGLLKFKPVLELGSSKLQIRDSVYDLAFSPDGKLIAATPMNGDRPQVLMFDVASGREVQNIRPEVDDRDRAGQVAFSPDGKTLLWGEWNHFAIWDLYNQIQVIAATSPNGSRWSAKPSRWRICTLTFDAS